LAAGKSCFYEADIKTVVSLSRRAVTNRIDNNVSGAIELFNSTGQLWACSPCIDEAPPRRTASWGVLR
jgi:hypothetical protein